MGSICKTVCKNIPVQEVEARGWDQYVKEYVKIFRYKRLRRGDGIKCKRVCKNIPVQEVEARGWDQYVKQYVK